MKDSKQAKLERWLADGKPITGLLAVKMWWFLDYRKGISRIRKKFKLKDAWVTRDGVRFKTWWMKHG